MKFKLNGEWKELTLKATDTLPIGTVLAFAGTTIPTGWLLCDGSVLKPEDYPELYNVIGTTYGVQGGFVLPDYRGKTLVCVDTSDTDFNELGKTGGSKDLQKHSHDWSAWAGGYDGNGPYSGLGGFKGYGWNVINGGRVTYEGGNGIKETGTGTSGNLQPYTVVNYIIKAFNTIASNTVLEDNLPVDSIIEYDGDTVPDGYEKVEETTKASGSYSTSNNYFTDNVTISGTTSVGDGIHLNTKKGKVLITGSIYCKTNGNGSMNVGYYLNETYNMVAIHSLATDSCVSFSVVVDVEERTNAFALGVGKGNTTQSFLTKFESYTFSVVEL